MTALGHHMQSIIYICNIYILVTSLILDYTTSSSLEYTLTNFALIYRWTKNSSPQIPGQRATTRPLAFKSTPGWPKLLGMHHIFHLNRDALCRDEQGLVAMNTFLKTFWRYLP